MRSSNVEKVWKELLGQARSRERRGIPSKRGGKTRNWRRSQGRETIKKQTGVRRTCKAATCCKGAVFSSLCLNPHAVIPAPFRRASQDPS